MVKKLICLVIISLFLIGIAFAEVQTLGDFKTLENINLKQIGAGFTNCYITSLLYPNSSETLNNVEMTKNGTDYNYTFSGAEVNGQYIVNGYCTDGSSDTVWSYDFNVNPSGSPEIGQGASISFIGFLLLMIIIGVILLVTGFKINSMVGKIGFFSFSVIVFIMAILYGVIASQQTLYGFTGLVTGSETFWFVIKSSITVGILALTIIIGLIMYKAWKIKKGYYDYD